MPSAQGLLNEANAIVPRISAAEATRLIAEKDALLIDVREAAELSATGKLKHARHVPLGSIGDFADSEGPGERPIILYCAAGIRSAIAGRVLIQRGFRSVHNLGGLDEATSQGMERETAEA